MKLNFQQYKIVFIFLFFFLLTGCASTYPDDAKKIENENIPVDNQQQTKQSIPGSTFEKIGIDKNELNIYSSSKYKMKFKTPPECTYQKLYSPNNGISNTYIFDCFALKEIRNRSGKTAVQNKNDFFNILCDSFYINDKEACLKGRESDIKEFQTAKLDDKYFVNTIELAGIPEPDGTPNDVSFEYYYITNEYIFSFSITAPNPEELTEKKKNKLIEIVQSFEIES